MDGLVIGLMLEPFAKSSPELIEILPNRPEWTIPLWLVTHVDQHKISKIQAFVSHLKECVKKTT